MSNEKRKIKCILTDFAVGLIVGIIFSTIIFITVFAFYYQRNKDKEKIQYVEMQQEIENMREDISSRDPAEFLEDPGVRRAADNARDEFDRKRDEALHRFRSGLIDR